MNYRWQFDRDFLIRTINDFKIQLLNSSAISSKKREEMQATIEEFSFFLDVLDGNKIKNDFDFDIFSNLKKEDFIILKRLFLSKACKDYNLVGEELINFVIVLADSFKATIGCDMQYDSDVSPDEIVAHTLEVYDNYLELFSSTAREIIDYPIRLINFSKNKNKGSECFYTFNLPFINVEEYNKRPNDFIHELQHGIEKIKGYNGNIYFKELGPILSETLYIDKMYEKKDYDAVMLYFERINECEYILGYLNKYFLCIKEFQKYNFEVKTVKFVEILERNSFFNSNNVLISDFLDKNILELLMYTLSFLKSLEVRNLIYQDKNKGLKLLNNTLTGKKDKHLTTDKMLNDYDDYLREIAIKRKKRIYTK